MTTTSKLTPTTLRAILAATLVSFMAIGVIIFVLGYRQVTQYSVETQKKASEALASNSTVNNLMSIKAQLKENAYVVTQASKLVSQSTLYVYQDQIITDINAYAAKAGISLDNITFNESATTSTTSTSTVAVSAPPAGVKTTTATVTFKNPVNYTDFLRFVHSLEQSLFRMSILGINIAKVTDDAILAKDPDAITCESISIEVYIR